MDFDYHLRELFHGYVPEIDYKWPLTENDKWYIFTNLAGFVTLIIAVLIFTLFCKIKHRWLVNAKCAFCNCVVRVWRFKLYWWFCNRCQRINGYPKNSFVQTDFSSMEEIRELQDHSIKSNISNNRISSPNNQIKRRLLYSKNDLNVSTIVSHSPKVFDEETDSMLTIPLESTNEIKSHHETSFQKMKNKIKEILKIDHDIKKLSSDTEDQSLVNVNRNSTRLPGDMDNLRKMRVQLLMDDVKRRMELLDAKKMLCDQLKQRKELEKSLRAAKRMNETRNTNDDDSLVPSHPISKRNTFFERSFSHSFVKSPSNIENGKETKLQIEAATDCLATVNRQLSELRELHANEIAFMKLQIKNKTKTMKQIEDIEFKFIEFGNKLQEDQFNCLKKQLQSEKNRKIPVGKSNQLFQNNNDKYNSKTAKTKSQLNVENEISVITEEKDDDDSSMIIKSPNHAQKTIDQSKQDNNKQRIEEQYQPNQPSSSSTRQRGGSTRIVKPIRSGQRPYAANKLSRNSSLQ